MYAGIVLTPIALYFCTGFEEPSKWMEKGEKPKHTNKTIPILTIIASLIFTVEGLLRMFHSYSIHRMVNYEYWKPKIDSFDFYYDIFQYAGSLLFFVSLFSAIIIGISYYCFYKEYRQILIAEAKKKSKIEEVINKITQKINADSSLLMSFEPKQLNETILHYNTFCQKIISALESSDEKNIFTFEYSTFNNIETSYKVLLLKQISKSFYFYPMGIVVKSAIDSYNYIPMGEGTVSVTPKEMKKLKALPSDVQPIRQFWAHSCLDGSPDLRYKYNPKTFVYKYGELSIGELILHVFRMNTAEEVVSTYNKMYSLISQLKEQKHHDKMNAIENVKNITPNNTGKKEINHIAEQSEENKTSKQNITIENPKTLEECFSDMILKHGTNILTDKNMVNIICSSYTNLDITEYKDVLDRMVSDNFLYQFVLKEKQNDFALYNLTSSYARQKLVNAQKALFIAQALVTTMKKNK